jgi:hypothetical protein
LSRYAKRTKVGGGKGPGHLGFGLRFRCGIFFSYFVFEVPSNLALERSLTVAQRCNPRAERLRHVEK